MRLLLTCSGGRGHLDPLLPLAWSAAARGHEITFAVRPWMTAQVEALGYTAFPTGTDLGLAPETRPLVAVDMERELRDLRDGFGRAIARERAADLVPLCRRWRPDIVVWDETDFAAPITAEALALPHASVVVIAAGSFVRPALMAPALDEVRASHGLPPDPNCGMLARHLVTSPVPPSFRDPTVPSPATLHPMRPWTDDEEAPLHRRAGRHSRRPSWADRTPGAPTIYVTLGTVFNHESGDLFPRILAGLAPLRANILVTVGREIDPASLGPQPPHVTVARFVPQADVLPHADLVVSHGGSGSVLGSLAHGVPLLVIPMGADQPLNAGRVVDLGCGVALDPLAATPDDVRSAATALLGDPAYASAAHALAVETAGLPAPSVAVARLETLVASWSPGSA